MTKLSPSYREDSSEGIDPEIRAYLDKEYFYKLDNLDVKNPKLLVVFAGGNAVGKSVLSERIGRELLGIRLENDGVKRAILQKYPELIMTDTLHQLVWKYTMDLYGRLGGLTQNGLVIRDGVITWYYDRILPVFLKQGYELLVVGYDLSERKSRELIEQRGDTPTTTKRRLLDLREDQRIHLERFFREYKVDIVLNDETVFDHEAVILAVREKLATMKLLPPPEITTSFEFRGQAHKCEWFDLPKDRSLPELEWQQVYAVGNYEGKVLVVHYPNGPDNLPGGKVDPGETAEMALHREITEELNMKILSWYPVGYQRVTSPSGEVVNQLRVYAVMDKIGEFVSDPGGHIIGHSLVEIGALNDAINYGLIGERMMELVRHEY